MKNDLQTGLLVVVLILVAYSAFVSSKVAFSLAKVDAEFQGAKKSLGTLEGWRSLFGLK